VPVKAANQRTRRRLELRWLLHSSVGGACSRVSIGRQCGHGCYLWGGAAWDARQILRKSGGGGVPNHNRVRFVTEMEVRDDVDGAAHMFATQGVRPGWQWDRAREGACSRLGLRLLAWLGRGNGAGPAAWARGEGAASRPSESEGEWASFRATGKIRPSGPKRRKGEERASRSPGSAGQKPRESERGKTLPFSFYLKCFPKTISISFEFSFEF
jgi:hypothetical protein